MIARFVTLLLLLASPAAAAVFEVGDDGALERLDTPRMATPTLVAANTRPTARIMASRAQAFRPEVDRAAQRYEVSPALIDAIARVESRYNPAAVSSAHAVGIMQLMPATARALGVKGRDTAANISGGTAYLRELLDRFDGDIVRAVAAYNAGPGAVRRAGGIPRFRETVAYVAAVMDQLSAAAQ